MQMFDLVDCTKYYSDQITFQHLVSDELSIHMCKVQIDCEIHFLNGVLPKARDVIP